MHLSAIDHDAEKALLHRREKLLIVVKPRVWEAGLREANKQWFLSGLYSTHLQCIHIFYLPALFSELSMNTPHFFAIMISANWSYCDQFLGVVTSHMTSRSYNSNTRINGNHVCSSNIF